ncbi:peptidoglycan-binding protein [Streptomyces sp. S.PNR 29]|uniref:peptidoglycan-binding domain-containing protein n=1 Tax=Streptomyces sp. S.PNR 29 TaxID=2973805 RepID=UPI0025AF65BC|nr:peptidoglycan-binding protein [Streptomyces sp. S.PNR 29]MDN0197234.1 peptidoglycan-binding protein [Streptomyces sp. S.PNR 29]
MSMRKRAVAMVTAALLAAGSTGIALAPAANAAAYHGIDGSGPVFDDWGEEEDLGIENYTESNATALWQTVLWADGAQWEDEDGDRHPFKKNQIDGTFGAETESATQWWQEQRGLAETDGVVTDETWERAQFRLRGPFSANSVQYAGIAHIATFKRVSKKYQVKLKGNGPWKSAHYDSRG